MAVIVLASTSPFKKRKVTHQEIVHVPKIIQPIVPKNIQQDNAHMPTIIQQESITQQPSEMNIHWTKQPSQWVGEVPLSVILSAHGPYFLYEDELSVALCNMVGMSAPSLSRARRMAVLSE